MNDMRNTPQSINRGARQHFDIPLTLMAFALAAYGVLAITAASYQYSDTPAIMDTFLSRVTNSRYGARQGLFLLVSPLAIVGMVAINYRFFQKFSGALYVAGLALLGLVLVIGSTTSGVTGWFTMFSDYMLQPSEFVKISVILHLAKFFARKDNPVSNVQEFVTMGIIMGIPLLLIFAQGELGTVIVFLAFYLAMMLISGMRIKIIVALLGIGIVAMIPVVLILSTSGSYRYDRLISFFDPSQASSDAIYQARNSQIAISNGGVNGTGLFVDGTYTALNYVPQNHTDFIFATIGETLGFVGCMIAVVLYALMTFRMWTLALNTHDKFARLVIVGVTMMIFFHIFYNIAMTIGLMPVMGIPLPFLSYGGSNLIANMAAIGLVLNITLHKPQTRMGPVDQALTGGGVRLSKKAKENKTKRRRRIG